MPKPALTIRRVSLLWRQSRESDHDDHQLLTVSYTRAIIFHAPRRGGYATLGESLVCPRGGWVGTAREAPRFRSVLLVVTRRHLAAARWPHRYRFAAPIHAGG